MGSIVAPFKKAVLTVAIVIAVLSGIGYATAKMAQPSVEQEIRGYVLAKGIKGLEMGGREVPPEEIEVRSWVKWPFVVVGSFEVPFDMHTSYHMTTYLVMPWGRYTLSKQSVYPV
jgi:hypothetical protein